MKETNSFQKSVIFGGKFNSDDWINFAPLPKLQEEDLRVLANQREYLTGEHDKIIQQFRTTNDFLENTNAEEIIKRGNQRSSLREIHRVAYLVQTITRESNLVPKNAFELNYSESLIPVKDFVNPWSELGNLESFRRFRRPSSQGILRFMAFKDREEGTDFLERVEESGALFALGKDVYGLNYFVKSTVWPGFVNYFRANSGICGHLYFGYGLRNADLHFTLN